MPIPSHDDPAKRSVPTATKSRHEQTSNKYEPLQPWPGSCYSDNRAIKQPKHRARSTGSGNRAVTRMERYRRLQPHVQKLLGSMEIARCEERHTRVQLESSLGAT
jgi:hypothetical protein